MTACGQDPAPAPRPKVQTKKIDVPAPTPSASAGGAAAAPIQAAPAPAPGPIPAGGSPAPADRPSESGTATGPVAATPPADPADETQTAAAAAEPAANGDAAAPTPTEASADLVQVSLQTTGTYNPTGRFDPFEPLFKESPQAAASTATRKRTAQTPLEQVALGQLKLSAIIRAPSGNRALVEDAAGKGYVVQKGTYIGLNSGQVVQIEKDRLVVEEEVENILGGLTVQTTELKLQKPAGEL